jgi:hypothetical protein
MVGLMLDWFDGRSGLLQPYEVVYTPAGTVVAQFFFTRELVGPLMARYNGVEYRLIVDSSP